MRHLKCTKNGNYPGRSIFFLNASSLVLIIIPFLLFGCGGGGGGSAPFLPPAGNVGGGYTLEASGGTLNDGSGMQGLVVLATLRDKDGNGPAAPWNLSISGPGIGSPLRVTYDDGSPSSYMTWWWDALEPLSGTYIATATDGVTTLVYKFSVNAVSNLSQPSLNKTSNTISWSSITGAGSYYYRVTDGTGADVMAPGYISSNSQQSSYSFQLPVLSDGSYLVAVYAQTTDRATLQNDPSPSPTLASPENMSLGAMDMVQGGGYVLNAKGGVLYEGQYPAGVDYYGLVIRTSILTSTTPTSAPAGDWNVSVTGPNIPGGAPITFTYPGTSSQYVYWDYSTTPAAGTYTVTATPKAGGAPISQTFSIPNPVSQLPVATGLAATPTTGGGASVSWNAASGAQSYYVNVWTVVNSVYTEIAGNWVAGTSATIAKGTLSKNVSYDVYVTACQLDMTNTTSIPPADPGTQVDMSDTTFSYETITAQ